MLFPTKFPDDYAIQQLYICLQTSLGTIHCLNDSYRCQLLSNCFAISSCLRNNRHSVALQHLFQTPRLSSCLLSSPPDPSPAALRQCLKLISNGRFFRREPTAVFEKRLSTFISWSHHSPAPQALAAAGFFGLGSLHETERYDRIYLLRNKSNESRITECVVDEKKIADLLLH